MYTIQIDTGAEWDSVDLDDALDADYMARVIADNPYRATFTKRGQLTVEMANSLATGGESHDDHYFNFKD